MSERSQPFPTWWAGVGWTIGLGVMGLVAYWRRRRSRRTISVSPLSESWLMEHELSSGRETDR